MRQISRQTKVKVTANRLKHEGVLNISTNLVSFCFVLFELLQQTDKLKQPEIIWIEITGRRQIKNILFHVDLVLDLNSFRFGCGSLPRVPVCLGAA